MQTKNIISVAAVVASFAGAALAGTPVKIVAPTPVPAPVATTSPLSGDIAAKAVVEGEMTLGTLPITPAAALWLPTRWRKGIALSLLVSI